MIFLVEAPKIEKNSRNRRPNIKNILLGPVADSIISKLKVILMSFFIESIAK